MHTEVLSIKAKGLYSIIQSFISIPGFTLYKNHLMKVAGMGKSSFDKAWKELKCNGYLKQYRIRDINGYVYEYELLDKADVNTPALQNVRLSGEIINLDNQEIETNPTTFNEGSKQIALVNNKIGKTSTILNNKENNTNSYLNNNQSNNQDVCINEEIIKSEIINHKSIQYEYANSVDTMKTVIHMLTEWNIFHPNGYSDEIRQDTYEMMNECLIEMATENNIKIYNNKKVSCREVIDRINDNLVFYDDIVLIDSCFIDEFIDSYIDALKTREITSPLTYMKACLWNSFITFKIQFHSNYENLLKG